MQERKAASGPSWAYWRNREWAYAEKGLALKQNLHAKMKKNLKGWGSVFLFHALLDFKQLLGGGYCRPFIPNSGLIVRFSAAHPAGTMDFPLGKSPCGPACPCTDIFFTSELAEDLLPAMDCALALLTIVTAVSGQCAHSLTVRAACKSRPGNMLSCRQPICQGEKTRLLILLVLFLSF